MDDVPIYSVARNDVYGRYLVASRDIKDGELILKESPTIVGAPINAGHICLKCNKHLKHSLKICRGCSIAPVCSLDCAENSHPDNECSALKQTGLQAIDVVSNSQIIMPLRCLLLKNYAPDKWENLKQLEAHTEKRRGTGIWNSHKESVEEVLKDLGQVTDDDLKLETVQNVCGILDINTFELRPPNLNGLGVNPSDCLRGVYLEASLMAHDCMGNTLLSVDDEFGMTVHASVPIAAGEMILFNYGNSLKGTHERRMHLKQGKYFDCACRRCSDPTELGTHLSSIRCSKCNIANVAPTHPLRDTFDSIWACEACQAEYPGNLIKSTIDQVKDKIESLDPTNFIEAEKLLQELQLTLSPNHYLILELKQNMISIYQQNLFTDRAMYRIIQLCQDVIKILNVIEPGISRLRGIATYQLQAAQVELANKLYQCKEIFPAVYVERLMEAEKNLMAAIKMLVYEPKNSPEGRLAQHALNQMQILRNTINQLKPTLESKLPKENDVMSLFGKKSKKPTVVVEGDE